MDNNTEVLVGAGGGAYGREVLRTAIQNGERIDPGVSCFQLILQHSGGFSGKGVAAEIMRPTGGITWTWMGGRRVQHSLLCGIRSYSGP